MNHTGKLSVLSNVRTQKEANIFLLGDFFITNQVLVLTPGPRQHKARRKRVGRGQGLVRQPSAFQVSFSFAKGSKKISHDHQKYPFLSLGLFVCFNAVKRCFYSNHLLNKLFNLVGSDGVLIIYSPKFRSLHLNSARTPFPSMSLFQLGESLRYLNNLPFSYMYEKMHSLSTIMQLCLSSEMAKRVSGAILRNRNRKAKAFTQTGHKKT